LRILCLACGTDEFVALSHNVRRRHGAATDAMVKHAARPVPTLPTFARTSSGWDD